MRALEEEFTEQERLSHMQTWCTPMSYERKVKATENFYNAFHDARTLPILTCKSCYRKHSRAELEEVEWDRWVESAIEKRDKSPFKCVHYFAPPPAPSGTKIDGCADPVRYLGRVILCPAA